MTERHGYNDSDDYDPLLAGRWTARVKSATHGKRGQKLLTDLIAALDALPEKRLIRRLLNSPEGDVCALGAVAKYRGIPPEKVPEFDPEHAEDYGYDEAQEHAEVLSVIFNAAPCLIQEVEYANDEMGWGINITPEERWRRMRNWAVNRLNPVDLVDLPEEAK